MQSNAKKARISSSAALNESFDSLSINKRKRSLDNIFILLPPGDTSPLNSPRSQSPNSVTQQQQEEVNPFKAPVVLHVPPTPKGKASSASGGRGRKRHRRSVVVLAG